MDRQFVRRRHRIYIGNPGSGSKEDDGLYVLLKEIINNSIEEYDISHSKKLEININDNGEVYIRDYGRGMPLSHVVYCGTFFSAGGMYDNSKETNKLFSRIGLRGGGLKVVNALSSDMEIKSFRNEQMSFGNFKKGSMIFEKKFIPTHEPDGTLVRFIPDTEIFGEFSFKHEIVEQIIKTYTYLNCGLEIIYNGEKYFSYEGMKGLLREKLKVKPDYPIIHLKAENIEIAFTHTDDVNEEYFTFVNEHFTKYGGTHLTAFIDNLHRVVNDLSNMNFNKREIQKGIKAVVSIRISDPVFGYGMLRKWNLISKHIAPYNRLSISDFIENFLLKELSLLWRNNPEVIKLFLKRIYRNYHDENI